MNWTQKFSVPRHTFIGGSDAVKLMGGERKKLWRLKKGLDQDDDLSDILPVVMGIYTEELNRIWFEKKAGLKVSRPPIGDDGVPKIFRHPAADMIACHPDGFVLTERGPALFEAKHIGPGNSIQDAVDRYYWQLVHNSMVLGYQRAFLSVFFGNSGWDHAVVDIKPEEQVRLLKAELEFWDSLKGEEPPDDILAELRATEIVNMREVDMTGNNQWAAFAADFIEAQPRAKTFEEAKEWLKRQLPADARRAFGHGISVTRARNNSITVRAQ